ncbi:bifunctional ADP-dependent NAD(P)H-hydrate dehydratase/NAD(P)H-hydrate epimerase [Pseudoxanthomonas dokdonensis]|uniref:Bifunctional NAD(P)H-hydrate repair enzyme n=1 Tax=Pseudoxanthomonas dokdonensis TaxID=344882 RepID=A0A0R0CT71_9GAMM|nr:bifunctional ADP-dependent NAD(P)H-hydrate dehydratase/NAD(P)H-hydrate epimerase [Pseudoxanthomonas dokdonensis]KRG68929.1 carbohydrate kinase [Pseudoxanthomonas dokdonensis]
MSATYPLFDNAAGKALDQHATTALGGDGYLLMQRAGQAAWQCLLQHWPQARRLVVVCGPGNNGGDGYVLARLARRAGRQVTVVHLQAHSPRSGLAQRACTDYLGVGGQVEWFQHELPDADVVVDALFGIGLDRAPDAASSRLIDAINSQPAPVLALDVPSGVDAQRGSVATVAVVASCTLQFIGQHIGLRTGAALEYGGALAFDDLDVPVQVFAQVAAQATLLEPEFISRCLLARRRNTHKGESGRVVCVGGGHGTAGAVVLAAEAALRSGAGLVAVATRERHLPAILARRPEIMAHGIESGDDLPPLLATADCIALGPGLGQGEWASGLHALTMASGKPLVLDADALNLLAKRPAPLVDAILTPHPGEAARLLDSDTSSIQRDRFAAAQALVERFQSVIVLKGAGTIIAAPGQLPRVINAGNPGMAVGGMGDLLTGVIAALRGQGLAAFEAASAGALIHSLAADEAAAKEGERGLLPSDLLPWLRYWVNH